MSSWLPSHAKITVKEGRELRLKGRGQGDLYVSLNVDKETLKTELVPRNSSPSWNHAFDITLMSLDTTVHLTVFQAGTFRESFIGYHSIFLGGFKLTNKPTSHWYKLGSRPGKPNTKLRGDILVTITFYSDWKPVIRSEGSWAESRFKRSMSLRHSRSEGLPTKDEATNGKDGRGKGSLLGVSLRRKKSSGGTEDCNEFSSFKSTVATTTTSSTSSQASTPVVQSTSTGDSWTSYTLPVRGKKGTNQSSGPSTGSQSSGPSTGSDSPSSEVRSAEGGGGGGEGGEGEGETGGGLRRGSGGSLRRRTRPRSIPDTYGFLPGTELANGSGRGDAASVGMATAQSIESERVECRGEAALVEGVGSSPIGGRFSGARPKLDTSTITGGCTPSAPGSELTTPSGAGTPLASSREAGSPTKPHPHSGRDQCAMEAGRWEEPAGTADVKTAASRPTCPTVPPGVGGTTPGGRQAPDRSQTQTAPPRLTGSTDVGGRSKGGCGEGEATPIKRMQSATEFAIDTGHDDKVGSPRCTTPSSRSSPSPTSAQYPRAEAPLFINEKTPANIRVAKKLILTPAPVAHPTCEVDSPMGAPGGPPQPPGVPHPPHPETVRSATPEKPLQSTSTLTLKGRRPGAGGGGGGLKRALTSYQESKKMRSVVVKPRTDRPLSSSTSREKLNDGQLGLQDVTASDATTTTATSSSSRKDVDIGISAALLMAIRTKSRPPAIAHGTVQQNCDPAVARQHATTSNSASSLSLSPSDTAHLGAALDESPASEGRSTPMEHTSNPSLHSEHSGDSSYVRSSSFVDCEFESMTAEDWAKWSKEDVIKALLKTREQLRSVDKEVETLHKYLEKLLDRIIETNPALLQIT